MHNGVGLDDYMITRIDEVAIDIMSQFGEGNGPQIWAAIRSEVLEKADQIAVKTRSDIGRLIGEQLRKQIVLNC